MQKSLGPCNGHSALQKPGACSAADRGRGERVAFAERSPFTKEPDIVSWEPRWTPGYLFPSPELEAPILVTYVRVPVKGSSAPCTRMVLLLTGGGFPVWIMNMQRFRRAAAPYILRCSASAGIESLRWVVKLSQGGDTCPFCTPPPGATVCLWVEGLASLGSFLSQSSDQKTCPVGHVVFQRET